MITAATWRKYCVLDLHVEALRVKDKRFIFQKMRTDPEMDHDTYLPAYGITAGEYAVWQVLCERKKDKERAPSA